MATAVAVPALAAAVAVPALAAAEREPAGFDEAGFGGSAIATDEGAAADTGFAAGAAVAGIDVDGPGMATVLIDSGAAFGLNRFEMSAMFQRDFASRRKVLRAMSRNGC